ncbi:MAG TPA: hypothetical protein VJR92_09145 [Gemmatimonadaceae bacterium]|nr:hypothetical protein [Gemmatimonadaceae bacterium]
MMFSKPLSRTALLLAFASFAPAPGVAQQSAPPPIDFSGVLFANFQRRTDSIAKATNGTEASSRFDVERVYLTFRASAGDRASVRITTDIYNNTDAATNGYYKGWTARLKYAYLQMNVANNIGGHSGFNAVARLGMLHNVILEHEETYWPRYLSTAGLERSGGFFSSADVGVAALVTLPKKLGEIYTNVVNGPGYTASEADRFKDFGARLTITPFANGTTLGTWGQTLAISPWFYAGQTASQFQNGGVGQVGPVSDGLKRNRAGVFVGVRDPRLSLGVSFGQRTETTEAGSNTVGDPRTTADNTGQLTSVFGIVRPGLLAKQTGRLAKIGVLGRVDSFKANTDADPYTQLAIFSLFYEPNSRITLSLDTQTISRKDGSTANELKALFLHLQASY